MTNKQIMFELSKDKEFFEHEAHRIFMILGTKIDINNYVEITIKEISEEININEKKVLKGIKILEKKNLLTKNNYGFKLNPNVIYRREIEENIEIKESEKDTEYYNKIYNQLIKELDKKNLNIDNLSKKFNLSKEIIEKIINKKLNEE